MFDRHQGGERVIAVHLDVGNSRGLGELEEFRELIDSAGGKIMEVITGMRAAPDSKYFLGKGKAEEVKASVLLNEADCVIVDHALSPAQERNLEQLVECRVLDRTRLILDIFSQRARTFEGKLQVELAQLNHMATRLIRGWTHLERQKGGIGLRGPGETQLESDRRQLRGRLKFIEKRLDKVKTQREQSRRARRRAITPTVSVVGYTNAGKSTLFNALTQDDIYVANQLFATLDPTISQCELPGAGNAVLADTVGFIRKLPHNLVQAFRATLEETRDANLLLHVIDISNPNWRDHVSEVEQVLADIGADQVPCLQVFNKIDALEDTEPKVELGPEGKPIRVWVAAQTKLGISQLRSAMTNHLYGDPIHRSLCLPPQDAKRRAKLYEMGAVRAERTDDEGNWWLTVCIARQDFTVLFPELHV